jgi:hypothetical protein
MKQKVKVGDLVKYITDGEVVPVLEIREDGSIIVMTEFYGKCTEDPNDLILLEEGE